nr:MAG TPA: hypothetical protein [Caudoviricetes sp.]
MRNETGAKKISVSGKISGSQAPQAFFSSGSTF